MAAFFSADSWYLLWPPLGVCFAAASHVSAVRLARRRSQWGHLLVGILVGAVYVAGATVASSARGHETSQLVAALILNILSYLGLAYIYADFNNLNFTSLRIRVLRECNESRSGLTTAQLSNRYDVTALVTQRLDDYAKKRFLIQEGDAYSIGKPTIAWVFRCYQLMYRVLFGVPMPASSHE